MSEPQPAPDSSRVDLRLAVPAVAAWSAAALLVPASARAAGTTAAVAAGVLLLSAVARRTWWVAAALGAAAAASVVALHLAALHRGPVAELARHRGAADVVVRLVRDPFATTTHAGRRLVVADATVEAVRRPAAGWATTDAPVVVLAHDTRWLGLLPGQRVQARGHLLPPRAGEGVAAALVASGEPTPAGRAPAVQRAAARVRDGLRAACLPLPPDERGLLPGVVLGDVSQMPRSLTDDFRATGLAHLNAVSGANCAIAIGAVAAAARGAGLGRRTRFAVSLAALLGFVVLARPSPSVLRAAVMGAVVLVGAMTGRRRRALPALSAAVLALVLVDPFLAPTPGFAMSVLATAAIVVLAPRWTERLSRRWPRPVAAAVAVPAAAQLACTPVIVAAFGQLTPYAVPANLLAAPAVAPATLLGLAAAVVSVVSAPAAAALAWLAALPVAWLALVARVFAGLPGSGVKIALGWRGVALLTAATAALAVGRVAWSRRAILGGCP